MGGGEVAEHLQELRGDAFTAVLGKHRHVGDVALIGGHEEASVAEDFPIFVRGGQEGGALVFQFFRLALDYTAVERVQFEDDDYFYYVKAVPKINLAVPERSVKKISEKEEATVIYEEEAPEEKYEKSLSDEERYAMGEELEDEPESGDFF